MPSTESGSDGKTFPYDQADYESLSCNLCGGEDHEAISQCDRNGLAVQAVVCRRCGLIFISPRMRPEWYAEYYKYEYRRQVARFRGVRFDQADKLQRSIATQRKRGQWLVEYLQRLGQPPPRRVLEIGSSTGGILRALADAYGCEVQGVDPGVDEAALAVDLGVPTDVALFEDWTPQDDRPFDLVICTQALNHVLDPRLVLSKARTLCPQGLLFVEVQDFFHIVEHRGAIPLAVQIDHVTMFSPPTLKALLTQVGFETLPGSVVSGRSQSRQEVLAQRKFSVPNLHTRILARSAAPNNELGRYEDIRSELNRLPNSTWLAQFQQARRRMNRQIRPLFRAVRSAVRGDCRKASDV